MRCAFPSSARKWSKGHWHGYRNERQRVAHFGSASRGCRHILVVVLLDQLVRFSIFPQCDRITEGQIAFFPGRFGLSWPSLGEPLSRPARMLAIRSCLSGKGDHVWPVER